MIDIAGLGPIIEGVRAIGSIARDLVNWPQAERDVASKRLGEALDEIDKSCVGLEAELVRLLAVDLGNAAEARATLVALEGGALRAAMATVRGHCSKIDIIYWRYLDGVLQRCAPQRHQEIQRAFGALHGADSVMLRIIDQLSAFVAREAGEVLDLLDDGNAMAAHAQLKGARREVRDLRMSLSELRYWLRGTQAEFNLASLAM